MKCNICGYPTKITYQEQDPDTGKIKTRQRTVECSGHYGIHPLFWNMHPDHAAMKETYKRIRSGRKRAR
jgi:hypothetical protein